MEKLGRRETGAICRYVAMLCSVSILGGCAQFGEKHFFGAFNESTGEVDNFYRLEVSGRAWWSQARYLSGTYDQRALDLFFNEIRTKDDNTSKLFEDSQKEPGTNTVIKPLSPDAENGAFVLILSTDADAVANTIGSFSESQVVAQAITNLVSGDQIRAKQASDAQLPILKATGAALESQLSTQLVDASNAANVTVSERSYLRVLNTLARGLGHNESFTSFDDARRWFNLERRTGADE